MVRLIMQEIVLSHMNKWGSPLEVCYSKINANNVICTMFKAVIL